jgi:antitoxin VapB
VYRPSARFSSTFRRTADASRWAAQRTVPVLDKPRIRVYTSSIYQSIQEARMDTAKLFQNGKSQAIRLPKEYRFDGTKVYLKKMGNAVVIIPEHNSWQSLFDSLDLFSDDFLADRPQPSLESREGLFE